MAALAGIRCAPASAPARVRSGTAEMADTLAAVYVRALANPLKNPFLSRERAEALQALLARQSGAEALNTRFLIAQERLGAGETREAITAIQSLMHDAGVDDDHMTAETKPLFEYLALAYLRLGEQENCLGNPAASVCILPLDSAARHLKQEGAREAITRFSRILAAFPDDYGSRWLLNLATMAIGWYPDSVPAAWRIGSLAPRPGDRFPRFPNIAGEVGAAVSGLAGGLAVEDFNGDGHLDLFTTSWGLNDPVHLLLADGTGRYADATQEAGLEGIVGGLNVVQADYDNDGDTDLFVLRGAWMGEAGAHPNSLLRNRGNGTFEDVTIAAGLLSFHPTQTAAFGDFNLDGWLDLFIGNESGPAAWGPANPSELYLNNRDGTFTEVSSRVGLNLNAFVKGVVWGDVNHDGLPDLFASVLYGKNRLFINQGGTSLDDWRFRETAAAAGVELPLMSFPTWFWDFDQDGFEDLLVLSYDIRASGALHDAVAREYLGLPVTIRVNGATVPLEFSKLYRNRGDGTFSDATRSAGLEGKVIYAMGSNFGDLDNDGWLDFYAGTGNPDLRSVIPNRMFRNQGGRRFEEVTLPGGFGHIQKAHATAFADLDRDGDEDVYMVVGGAYPGDRFTSVLFENPGWPGRNWVTLRLEGTTANRSAIGARVELVAQQERGPSRPFFRTVGTGGSFGAGALELHLGLGPSTAIRSLTIHWPDSSRTTTEYSGLAINRSYHIRQGSPPDPLSHPPVEFRKVPLGPLPKAHQHPR
jgi:hypothetical protein